MSFIQVEHLIHMHPHQVLIDAYIGGDDLKMKGWDIRQGGVQPLFTNKRLSYLLRSNSNLF